MSRAPLYAGARPESSPPNGGHAGLWHGRFFGKYADSADWQVDGKKAGAWLKKLNGKRGDTTLLERAATRQVRLARGLRKAKTRTFTTTWHFVTGMGLPHPAENGFTWHPTLGVPYLCGAAVKGLLRAWVEAWADLDDDARTKRIETWFGKDAKAGQQGHAGHLLFFDALPVEKPLVVADVMTPHGGKWYESGDQIRDATGATCSENRTDASRIPGDFHSPNPVSFLVVQQATFLFVIGARSAEGEREVNDAMDALEQALDLLGAGAKTANGYGPMTIDPKALEIVRTREEKQRNDEIAEAEKAKEAAQAQVEADRIANERKALPEFERSVYKIADDAEASNMAGYKAIIKAIEGGTWTGDPKRRAAFVAKTLMQQAKAWRPESFKARPERDRPYKLTLKVMNWLGEGDS